MATFLGAQLDKSEPAIIIDFGATGSRLIAIANNEVRYCQTLCCGGDAIDQAISEGLQEKFDIQITPEDARNIKHRIAAAYRFVLQAVYTLYVALSWFCQFEWLDLLCENRCRTSHTASHWTIDNFHRQIGGLHYQLINTREQCTTAA